MRALLDVNVLLALLDPGHAGHATARAWWHAHSRLGWASCPATQNGFIRVITLPAYRNGLSMANALSVLSRQLALPGHEFRPDNVSITDTSLFDHKHIQGPKQITDVHLLGLATANQGRLVTFDTGIPLAAVRGAGSRNYVTL